MVVFSHHLIHKYHFIYLMSQQKIDCHCKSRMKFLHKPLCFLSKITPTVFRTMFFFYKINAMRLFCLLCTKNSVMRMANLNQLLSTNSIIVVALLNLPEKFFFFIVIGTWERIIAMKKYKIRRQKKNLVSIFHLFACLFFHTYKK